MRIPTTDPTSKVDRSNNIHECLRCQNLSLLRLSSVSHPTSHDAASDIAYVIDSGKSFLGFYNMADSKQVDQSRLKTFENAAAGHDGVMSDESGELIIKPCTEAEIAFYQESLAEHPKFYELMPVFMGTLSLGAPQVPDGSTAAALSQEEKDQNLLRGKKLTTETGIVLENLAHGFNKPNVLDLKLGARLYADGTEPDKAERLDKVASETTSGSLNFRIAGMTVWNGKTFDSYDKFYGRKFNKDNVKDGFATFFSSLVVGSSDDDARQLLETILAEITKARHSLERSESRMYSASILIVYEGDTGTLDARMGNQPPAPVTADEKAPSTLEVRRSQDEDEDEDEEAPPPTHRVKMIDFAHAAWTPGQGPDENVIKGLKNIEDQMDTLIARFD